MLRRPDLQLTRPGDGEFDGVADFYDHLMRAVPYDDWVDYVEALLERWDHQPRLVLDLACGTGVPTVLLARAGYQLVGVDRSEAMLAVLRRKIARYPVQVLQADMRDFVLPEPADAAISLYDSVNYLLTPDDLGRCFQAVSRNLKPGGLFVFDMNTVFGLANYWGDRTSVREVEDIYSVWQTRYDPDTGVSSLHLTFYVHEGAARVRYDEIHEERGYQYEEVERLLRVAGFGLSDFYKHGTLEPPSATTSRIMVVARK